MTGCQSVILKMKFAYKLVEYFCGFMQGLIYLGGF